MNQPRRRRNVAKLLARLNPKGMALQPSGGSGSSLPVETAIDIAAGLGAVGQLGHGPHLAAMVLCLRWWPGMFEGPSRAVGYRQSKGVLKTKRIAGDREVVNQSLRSLPMPMRTAAGRRLSKVERERILDVRLQRPREPAGTVERLVKPARDQDGRLKWETVRTASTHLVPIEAPGETDAFRAIASLLANRIGRRVHRLRQLKAEHPKVEQTPVELVTRASAATFLDAWARAVIHEYRHPNHCQTCTPWGRAGEVPRPVEENGKVVRVEWRTCDTCAGAGVMAWSSKRRAKALRIGEHPWRNHLNPIHEGALSLLRELEWRGARLLVRRLGG